MNSGFFSTRGRALKFPEYGVRHTLHITQPVEYEQQTEDGRPLWWDKGCTRPKEQAILSGYVHQGLVSPEDDGYRSVYIRGGLQKALGAACRRAGVREPGFGMILVLEYMRDGPQPADPNKRPPKEYSATLEVVKDAEDDPRFRGPHGEVRLRRKSPAGDEPKPWSKPWNT